MLDGRGFFLSDKEIFLAILTYGKEKRRSMAEKRPLRRRSTVVNTGSKRRPNIQMNSAFSHPAGRAVVLFVEEISKIHKMEKRKLCKMEVKKLESQKNCREIHNF